LGPIPQPKSTLSFPLTSIKLLIPVSVFVSTIDFYLAEHERISGQSGLFYRSNKTSSIIELPETASFLMVSPLFKLKICIFPSFVPKTHKFGFKATDFNEQTSEELVKLF
jgi:hypothetical protein